MLDTLSCVVRKPHALNYISWASSHSCTDWTVYILSCNKSRQVALHKTTDNRTSVIYWYKWKYKAFKTSHIYSTVTVSMYTVYIL